LFDPFNNVYKDPIFSELGSRKFIEKRANFREGNTLAKTEIMYQKNERAKVAMDFT
jgi:hypothetical protein